MAKWTAAQRAKFKATMKAKREAGEPIGRQLKAAKAPLDTSGITEAIVYLKHAEANINARLASGQLKRMDRAHLLTLLALKTLTEN